MRRLHRAPPTSSSSASSSRRIRICPRDSRKAQHWSIRIRARSTRPARRATSTTRRSEEKGKASGLALFCLPAKRYAEVGAPEVETREQILGEQVGRRDVWICRDTVAEDREVADV